MKNLIIISLTALALGSAFIVAQPPAAQAQAPAKLALIDINKASKNELDGLPGIGAGGSEAIIKGRPYKQKDDLVRKKIFPQSVYDGIKDRIIAEQ